MGDRRGGAGNFAENTERAAEAGRKGSLVSGGNFKHDTAWAAEAGLKGGQISKRISASVEARVLSRCKGLTRIR